jgi:hypothetical protein
LRTEFSFRSIPFASPFRELCVQSLTAFWRAISQIVKQDIFEIVELHPSVPEFIPSTDCSNTMVKTTFNSFYFYSHSIDWNENLND